MIYLYNLINKITITNKKTGNVNKHAIKMKDQKMFKTVNGKKPRVKIMVTFE